MKEELKYLNDLIIKKLEFMMQWQPVVEEDPSKDISELMWRLEKDIQLLKNVRTKIKASKECLEQVNATLERHGKIDANTDLHNKIKDII